MAGPLDGIRILDVSEVISGPLAAMVLADQGADVIKVEPPRYGEESRQPVNYRAGMAALYANCNHGKRSIGLDLKTEEGHALFLELAATADVVIQNWRPGAAERLRIGEADLRAVKPDLIYGSITGYGDDGPYANRRGYDPIFQALTGHVAAQLNPEIPIPDLIRNAVVDKATSLTLAQAITAALFARERGQGGQHVRVAMLDVGLAFFWPDGMLRHTLVGDDVSTYVVPGERYQATPTRDGQIIFWTGTAEQMRAGLRAMGRHDLAESDRHRGVASGEEANALERAEVMAAGIAKMTTRAAYEALVAEEVPVAPVLQHQDVLEDPQLVHNGAILEARHPVYGPYRRARAAARFSGTPTGPSSAPALYGEHTDEILAELGRDEAARSALRTRGVVPAKRD
ncbi:MAG: CoA transferase [Myxococcota bacterium]